MGNFQFNIAKGAIKTMLANVGTGNARLIVVPLEATSEADEALKDHNDLEALLAGTSNEQTDMGRKTLTNSDITITVNDTNNRLDIDMVTDITWSAATGDPIDRLIFCYDADTTGGDDGDIVPLLAYDFDATPSGIDIIVSAHANGLIQIS